METEARIAVRKWVQRAIALYEGSGEEKVLSEISNPSGRFIHGDLYIYALDSSGIMLAHPVESRFTGKLMVDLKDSDGKAFIRKIVDISSNKGYGYADYKWHKPGSKKESCKTVFFERIDGIIFCSGFYPINESPLKTK